MGTNTTLSRREFLKSSLVAGALTTGFPTIIPASAIGRGGRAAPSERVVIGCLGVGDRGTYLMGSALQLPDVQIRAVADVKRDRRDTAKAAVDGFYGDKGCDVYNEFEEITGRDDIDACIVASCDHWHVTLALAAVRAGKDVYVEKPLGVSLEQDQTLRKAVRRHKRIFQFGTQQRSDDRFRRACELVLNGRIGKLKTINVWSPASASGGPTERVPVPETLDYDRWLGPAPSVPYTKERESNKWWWFISDYAIGFIAGWGIHPIDIALWGAGKLAKAPVRISGKGAFPTEGLCNTATSWDITCAYESGFDIRYRSEPAPAEWKDRYGQISGHGTAFEGTDGWVHVNRSVIRTGPDNVADSVIQPDEIHLIKSDHHMRNFVECVKSRNEPISPIEAAVQGDVLCQICDVAIRLDREVRWDTKKERFSDDAEANHRLERAMRSPWRLDRM
jgi:predicted dehydrogenase